MGEKTTAKTPEATSEDRQTRFSGGTVTDISTKMGEGAPTNEAGQPIQPYEVLAGLAAAYEMSGKDASPLYALTAASMIKSAFEHNEAGNHAAYQGLMAMSQWYMDRASRVEQEVQQATVLDFPNQQPTSKESYVGLDRVA